MIDNQRRLELAQARAQAARGRLIATLGAFQQRLTPAALAGDMWDEVRERSGAVADDALAFARRRPAAAAGAIALLIGYFFRRRLAALILSLFSGAHETEAAPDQLKAEQPHRPVRRRARSQKETDA